MIRVLIVIHYHVPNAVFSSSWMAGNQLWKRWCPAATKVPLDFLQFDRSPILCLKGNKQKQQTSEISDLATEIYDYIWLVVSTPLKNISQLGLLFPIYTKINSVPNHQPDIYHCIPFFQRQIIYKCVIFGAMRNCWRGSILSQIQGIYDCYLRHQRIHFGSLPVRVGWSLQNTEIRVTDFLGRRELAWVTLESCVLGTPALRHRMHDWTSWHAPLLNDHLHMHVHTYLMLLRWTFTCTCIHT